MNRRLKTKAVVSKMMEQLNSAPNKVTLQNTTLRLIKFASTK